MKKKKPIKRPAPKLDIERLKRMTPAEQARIMAQAERIENRRDTQLNMRFRQRDIEAWRSAADKSKQTLTVWMEQYLNTAAAKD